MENHKKVDCKEEVPIRQSLDVNKGPTLFGSVHPPNPKEYACPNCGTILAADILWKDTEDGKQKPFCGYCRKPVVLISKTD